MKPQVIISMRTLSSVILVTSLLIMVACNSKQGNSKGEMEKSSAAQASPKPPEMDIHTATFLGDLDAIHQHISAGSDLNIKEPSMGSTPLISAAVFGKTEAARALIKAGADVNVQNYEGSTALHSAAFLCRKEIVEMLLDNGVDKEIRNNVGSSALESVSAPFEDVKFIYDIFSKDLGPMGFKLDYDYVKATRPIIAELLQ